jgi:type I restriction enzyme S subunit
MSFPKYEAYKDSGVEWLGEVPKHWLMGALKHMAWIRNGRDYKDVEGAEGDYPVIGSGGQFSTATQFLYDGESVLLGRKGTIDKPLYVNGRFWTVDTMFYTEIFNRSDAKFLYYCALAIPFRYYSKNTALPSMTQEDLSNNPIAIPPIQEQTQIARFLDHETARIDALIAEQKRLIELLKEKRQAVISHAVTKGLDPTAPLKDSGVEWLGEVPEHWEVTKAKFVSDIFAPQRNKPDLNETEGFDWVTMEDMKEKYVSESVYRVNIQAAREAGSKILPKDSVIASCVGRFGIAAINSDDVIINQQLQAFVPKQIKSEYLRELVALSVEYFELIGTAATLAYVNQQGFENMPVFLPPPDEQKQVCSYVDRIRNKYEGLLNESYRSIRLLQERRSALISAAVTGKIDVRGWQAPASAAPAPTPVPLRGIKN